jgi:hypothetical protein
MQLAVPSDRVARPGRPELGSAADLELPVGSFERLNISLRETVGLERIDLEPPALAPGRIRDKKIVDRVTVARHTLEVISEFELVCCHVILPLDDTAPASLELSNTNQPNLEFVGEFPGESGKFC